MSVLVSGGAGYIGSHTCVELLQAGYEIVVADNFYNASPEALRRVEQITGKKVPFVKADMTDKAQVEAIFESHPDIDCVIQFAAYKAVGESVQKPVEYYYNNLNCTLVILDVMRRHGLPQLHLLLLGHGVRRPRQCAHHRGFPGGRHHQPLRHHQGVHRADSHRPVQGGAPHERGPAAVLQPHRGSSLRPDRRGPQRHSQQPGALYCPGGGGQAEARSTSSATITHTPDGTGVRDYIHVVDLARGHVAALKKLESKPGLFSLQPGHRPRLQRIGCDPCL